jgi:hypothetical protein
VAGGSRSTVSMEGLLLVISASADTRAAGVVRTRTPFLPSVEGRSTLNLLRCSLSPNPW